MEISFGPTEGTAPASAVETKPAVTVPAVVGAPGVPDTAGPLCRDRLPEFKEIVLPRLNIVQGVGSLKDQHAQGAIIYNRELAVYEPPIIDKSTGKAKKEGTPPLRMLVLGFRPTRFVEKIVGGDRGMIVNTEDEVRAAGGTLDYKEWDAKKASGMKRFEALAEAVVLIERPAHCKDDDTVFIYPVGNAKYALCLWAMKGTAYTAAAKRVFHTQRLIGCLRRGYPTRVFDVITKLEKFGNNSAWVPAPQVAGETDPELLKLAQSILSGE